MTKFHSRLSSVDLLPKEVKAQLDAAIAEGRKSLAELAAVARTSGMAISQSAVGRYIKREERRRPHGAGSVPLAVLHYLSLCPVDRENFRYILVTLEPGADWPKRPALNEGADRLKNG